MLQYSNYQQKYFFNSMKLSYSDLKSICIELAELSKIARENEIAYFKSSTIYSETISEEEKKVIDDRLQAEIELVHQYGQLSMTINDGSGEQRTIIFDSQIEGDFNKIQIPQKILKITFDNTWRYNAIVKKIFFHQIKVELDFSDAEVFSFKTVTPETSCYVEVTGILETSVLGSIEKIKKIFDSRSQFWNSFLHKKLKYDLIIWVIGIPLTFLTMWKMKFGEEIITMLQTALQPIAYLTNTLLLLTGFRLFYNYIKWLFPYAEIVEQPKTLQLIQRSAAGFIALLLLKQWGSGLIEVIGKILSNFNR